MYRDHRSAIRKRDPFLRASVPRSGQAQAAAILRERPAARPGRANFAPLKDLHANSGMRRFAPGRRPGDGEWNDTGAFPEPNEKTMLRLRGKADRAQFQQEEWIFLRPDPIRKALRDRRIAA